VTGVANSRCHCLPAAIGSAAFRWKASRPGRTRIPGPASIRSRPDTSETLGIPLVGGRDFTRSDAASAPKVVIVNEAFVKKFNLGRDAVGKRIGDTGGHRSPDDGDRRVGPEREIQRGQGRDSAGVLPPYRQEERIGTIHFYVRTSLDPRFVPPECPEARCAARSKSAGPNAWGRCRSRFRTTCFLDRLHHRVVYGVSRRWRRCWRLSGFTGVLAYTVGLSGPAKIGLAHGARGPHRARVRGMVMRRCGLMTSSAAPSAWHRPWRFGRLAQSLLFQLQGWESVVLVGAAVAPDPRGTRKRMIPAVRASQVEPMQACG